MQCEELEQCLNDVINDLYTGLNELAAMTRNGATPDEQADSMELLARTICDHWPDCFAANPYTPPETSQAA